MNAPAPLPAKARAALAAATDAFRSATRGLPHADHVLAIFFLKVVSDAWHAHVSRQVHAHRPHGALIHDLLRTERFVLPRRTSFQALHALRDHGGNSERIAAALHALEQANAHRLHQVFRHISFDAPPLGDDARRNFVLRRLLEDMAHPALRTDAGPLAEPQAMAAAFDFLVGRLSESGTRKSTAAGLAAATVSFGPPPALCELVARVAHPQLGDEIVDPLCGHGDLLLACARHAARTRRDGASRAYGLHGQEADQRTWAIARMRLFLRDEDNHCIACGDALAHPSLLDEAGALRRFDVAVAQLPTSSTTWPRDCAASDPHRRFERGIPPRTRADYAYILHMAESLKPRVGRMAAIVSQGVLFRGAAEGAIRDRLLQDNLVHAVIGLPDKLFHSRSTGLAVLVLHAGREDTRVLFIDASRGFQPGRSQNLLRPQDIQAIEDAMRARKPVPAFAALATPEEIARQGGSLSVGRYVGAGAPPIDMDFEAMRRERRRIRAALARLERQTEDCMKVLRNG